MYDLDGTLARLADVPAPHALDDIEARVLARIGEGPGVRTGPHIGMVATAALAIGVVGGLAGGGVPATASETMSLSPLTGGSSLAPSTLLSGAP